MDIKEIGSGVWLFGIESWDQIGQFPEALASFKREHPNLRVTAMTTNFSLFQGMFVFSGVDDQILPNGYVVNTEEKE